MRSISFLNSALQVFFLCSVVGCKPRTNQTILQSDSKGQSQILSLADTNGKIHILLRPGAVQPGSYELHWRISQGSLPRGFCAKLPEPAKKERLIVDEAKVPMVDTKVSLRELSASPAREVSLDSPSKLDPDLIAELIARETANFFQLCLFSSDGSLVEELQKNSQSIQPAEMLAMNYRPDNRRRFALQEGIPSLTEEFNKQYIGSTTAYARACQIELGQIPTPNCFVDGRVVPLSYTQHGQLHENFVPETEKYKCDRPILLGTGKDNGQCIPWVRAGSYVGDAVGGDEPSQWAFVCRRYKVRPEDSPIFDDVNMIGYNPNTGATCFFNSWIKQSKVADEGNLNKSIIPNPTSPQGIKFWMPATPYQYPSAGFDFFIGNGRNSQVTQSVSFVGCVRCHDSDPFIHSPFIDQVGVVPSHPNGPYYAVYFADQTHWQKNFGRTDDGVDTNGWGLTHLVDPGIGACTECHRIGQNHTCQRFAAESIGAVANRFLTDESPHKKWMPEGYEPGPEEVEAVKRIYFCCNNRDQCQWQPMERSPPHPTLRQRAAQN